jgi:hypothetical protein
VLWGRATGGERDFFSFFSASQCVCTIFISRDTQSSDLLEGLLDWDHYYWIKHIHNFHMPKIKFGFWPFPWA